jgi:hypothetical protein
MPLPLHEPSVPQVAAPWSAHWFNGSCPGGTDMQVPTEPVSAHDAQSPVHAVEQQTPCAHWFELHISAEVHGAPLGSFPQLMPVQLFGATQSPFPVHGGSRQVGVPVLHW